MQSPQELESWYATPDPWAYETTEDDAVRKRVVLSVLGEYERALDIGAGEGWLTKDLPAKHLFGYELSDNAAGRFPSNVKRVESMYGEYDLVICTGVLYTQYDWECIIKALEYYRDKATVLTCNIHSWERGLDRLGKPDVEQFFNYREYIEHLCVYNPIR